MGLTKLILPYLVTSAGKALGSIFSIHLLKKDSRYPKGWQARYESMGIYFYFIFVQTNMWIYVEEILRNAYTTKQK